MKKAAFLMTMMGLLLTLSSCRMRGSGMTDAQRQQLEAAYDSLQSTYNALIQRSEAFPDSLQGDLGNLYAMMRQMNGQTGMNHRQMMSMNMGEHMRGGNMMSGEMGMRMQNHMTGEWYRQMMSMHRQMAALHDQLGQAEMADMNRRLSGEYGRMMRMVPGLGEATDVPFNEEGDPALLDGANIYTRNCASCHGSDATGMAGVFPPLVNSEWMTGDESVPIRILLHGVEGPMEVGGEQYEGIMPSFKARLSAAEIASVLNYVRSLDNGEFSQITQEDVIRVNDMYSGRTDPWNPAALTDE